MKTLLFVLVVIRLGGATALSKAEVDHLRAVLKKNLASLEQEQSSTNIHGSQDEGVAKRFWKRKFWDKRSEFDKSRFTTVFKGLRGDSAEVPYVPGKEFLTYYSQRPLLMRDYERIRSLVKEEVAFARKFVAAITSLFNGLPSSGMVTYTKEWAQSQVQSGSVTLKEKYELYSTVGDIIQRMFGAIVAGSSIPRKDNEVGCEAGHNDWYCVFEKYFYLEEAYERWDKEIRSKLSLNEQCDRDLASLENRAIAVSYVKIAMETAMSCIKQNIDQIVRATDPMQAKNGVMAELVIYGVGGELLAEQLIMVHSMVGADGMRNAKREVNTGDNEVLEELKELAKSLQSKNEIDERNTEKIFDQIHDKN